MPVTHYDVGDVAVLDAEFDVDGTPTDPSTVTFDVLAPDGTLTRYELGQGANVGQSGPGVFFCQVPVTMSGYWRYRSTGDDPAPGSASGLFTAGPDPFDPDYAALAARRLCTVEEVKAYADEDLSDTSRDLIWERLIDDCAQEFYRYTHREFTPQQANPSERKFDLGEWEVRERLVDVGDLASTQGLVVKLELLDGTPLVTLDPDGTVPAASIVALPRNRDAWEPITELWFPRRDVAHPAQLRRQSVLAVTGDWGFPEVPGDVRQLAIEQVAIWWERDVAKFAGTWSLEGGRTIRPRALDDAVRDGLELGYRLVEVG